MAFAVPRAVALVNAEHVKGSRAMLATSGSGPMVTMMQMDVSRGASGALRVRAVSTVDAVDPAKFDMCRSIQVSLLDLWRRRSRRCGGYQEADRSGRSTGSAAESGYGGGAVGQPTETCPNEHGSGAIIVIQETSATMVNGRIQPREAPMNVHAPRAQMKFVDGVKGGGLDCEQVINALRLEIDHFRKTGVDYKVPRKGGRRRGAKVSSTKWVGTSKGSQAEPNYRSRLVGRELSLSDRPNRFAAPPTPAGKPPIHRQQMCLISAPATRK